MCGGVSRCVEEWVGVCPASPAQSRSGVLANCNVFCSFVICTHQNRQFFSWYHNSIEINCHYMIRLQFCLCYPMSRIPSQFCDSALRSLCFTNSYMLLLAMISSTNSNKKQQLQLATRIFSLPGNANHLASLLALKFYQSLLLSRLLHLYISHSSNNRWLSFSY